MWVSDEAGKGRQRSSKKKVAKRGCVENGRWRKMGCVENGRWRKMAVAKTSRLSRGMNCVGVQVSRIPSCFVKKSFLLYFCLSNLVLP